MTKIITLLLALSLMGCESPEEINGRALSRDRERLSLSYIDAANRNDTIAIKAIACELVRIDSLVAINIRYSK